MLDTVCNEESKQVGIKEPSETDKPSKRTEQNSEAPPRSGLVEVSLGFQKDHIFQSQSEALWKPSDEAVREKQL